MLRHGVILFVCFIALSCNSFQQDMVNVYIEQGNAYYKEKQYSDARDAYIKVQQFEDLLEINMKLVDIYIQLEQYEKAREMLDIVMQRDGDNEIAQELNAYYYLCINDYQTSITLYTALLESADYQPRVLGNLGVLHARMGNLEKSYTYIKQAIEIAYIDINVLKNYFTVLIALHKQNTSVNIPVDLLVVIEGMKDAYSKEYVSLEEIKQVANTLLESNFPQYAYSLYAFLVKDLHDEKKATTVQDSSDEEETESIQDSNDEEETESIQDSSDEEETEPIQDSNDGEETEPIQDSNDGEETEPIQDSNDGEETEPVQDKIDADISPMQNSSQESTSSSDNKHKLKEILFILSQISFNKDYDIIVSQRFSLGLTYLEFSLDGGYGQTFSEKQTLLALIDLSPTEVLKNRIRQLYVRYGIKQEFEP